MRVNRPRRFLSAGQGIKRDFDQVVRVDEDGDPARSRLLFAIPEEIVNLRSSVYWRKGDGAIFVTEPLQGDLDAVAQRRVGETTGVEVERIQGV